MMKKTILLAISALLAGHAAAHELWVVTQPAEAGKPVQADLAYSHNFPHAASIDKDREAIFKPLELYSENGKSTMQLHHDNFQYQSAAPAAAGGYWAAAYYQPTFWSKNAEGWKQQTRQQMPDASYCERAVMYGKMYTETAGTNSDFYQKPLGFDLEIVPLANPAHAKAGELFPVQILAGGKPLAKAAVTATSDTFVAKDLDAEHEHRQPQAFSGITNQEGKVNIIPLTEGFWKIKVKQTSPYSDSSVCDENEILSTMTLLIGSGELPQPENGEHHHHH